MFGIRHSICNGRLLYSCRQAVCKTTDLNSNILAQMRLQGLNFLPKGKHFRRPFNTTPSKQAAPLVAMLLKTGGIKIMKASSIVFGRSFRKLYLKLPESIRARVGKHRIFFSVLGLSTPFIAYYSYTHYEACPITGRKRWITFTREQVVALSDLDYKHLLSEYQNKLLQESHPLYLKNHEIVSKLINGNLDIHAVKDTDWCLHVIDDPEVTNAFVLPNGHIFVFTGMLKMLNTWEEMAIILGHEMSHAILGHAQEQQSYLAFGELLTVPLLAFVWFMLEDFTAFLVYTIQHYMYPLVYELGFNLPYSRLLEAEADEVGLMLSSKACYDPRWSVLLWEKMAFKEVVEGSTEAEESDFFSTHPGSQKRSLSLEKKLPEMLEVRRKCNCPPIPVGVDPQAAATVMRKCMVIVKERKALANELELIQILLQSEKFVTASEVNQKEEEMKKLVEESEALQRKLDKLDNDYKKLFNLNELDTQNQKLQSDTANKDKEKSGVLVNIWYKITGNRGSSERLTDTLFEKENKLSTVNLHKSAFGSTKSL